ATTLVALERLLEAETMYRRAITLAPQVSIYQENLAKLLMRLYRFEEATPLFASVLKQSPSNPQHMSDLAVALMRQRFFEQAEKLLTQAVALAPEAQDILQNYGFLLLMQGSYLKAWQIQEQRFKSSHYKKGWGLKFSHPLWMGDYRKEITLLLLAEQGFGDTIQMARYLPEVKKRVGRVVVSCDAALAELFLAQIDVDQVISPGESPPEEIDLCLPMFSLPHRFQTEITSIPVTVPYLSVPSSKGWGTFSSKRHSSQCIEHLKKSSDQLKVGLIWQGKNQNRFQFSFFKPLLSLAEQEKGIVFYSLQFGAEGENAEKSGICNLGGMIQSFSDTAFLMDQMDLMITIDTAAAHLAGAIARPFWLMLHFDADWRWGKEGNRSPWYPEARLFRQKKMGDWSSVVMDIHKALSQHLLEMQSLKGGGDGEN
ncbi:tetratricopeptide repeat protein, partial [Magnetococcales bacterium HHB-1]